MGCSAEPADRRAARRTLAPGRWTGVALGVDGLGVDRRASEGLTAPARPSSLRHARHSATLGFWPRGSSRQAKNGLFGRAGGPPSGMARARVRAMDGGCLGCGWAGRGPTRVGRPRGTARLPRTLGARAARARAGAPTRRLGAHRARAGLRPCPAPRWRPAPASRPAPVVRPSGARAPPVLRPCRARVQRPDGARRQRPGPRPWCARAAPALRQCSARAAPMPRPCRARPEF